MFWSRVPSFAESANGEMDAWGSQDGQGVRWHKVAMIAKQVLTVWPAVSQPVVTCARPRGRKPDPIWGMIEPEVLAWLDDEGEMPQAAVERCIANLLAARGETRAESTVREYARKWLDTHRKARASL